MQQTFPLPRPFMSPLLALNKYTGLSPPSVVGGGGASRLSPLTERHARKEGGGGEEEGMGPPPWLAWQRRQTDDGSLRPSDRCRPRRFRFIRLLKVFCFKAVWKSDKGLPVCRDAHGGGASPRPPRRELRF